MMRDSVSDIMRKIPGKGTCIKWNFQLAFFAA